MSVPAGARSPSTATSPAAMDKVLEDTARRGVPPERVAETIERALSARRMRARYVVGTRREGDAARQAPAADLVFDQGRAAGARRAERPLTPAAGTPPARRTGWWWPPASAASPVRRRRGQRFAVPGEQVQAFAVERARLRVARVVGGERVQGGVVVERVQREHPLQVDRVVLRGEVEQVAEAVERGGLQLVRRVRSRPASPVSRQSSACA